MRNLTHLTAHLTQEHSSKVMWTACVVLASCAVEIVAALTRAVA